VDGKFSDWDDEEMIEDSAATENPHIDLVKYRALLDNTHLSLYMEAQETLLQGLGESGDSLQLFFDTDQDETTGYAFPYFGADYLLEVYGKDNRVLSSHLYVFDENHRTKERRSPNDWNAWAPMFAVETAVKGNKLETQLWRDELQIEGNNVNLRIRLADSAGNVAESPTFNTGLNLVQLMIEPQIGTPLQPAVSNDVLTVDLVPVGEELVLSSLSFKESSTATSADFNEFSFYKGSEKIAEATMKRNSLSFEGLELSLTEETTLTLKTSLSINVVSGHVLSLALTDVDCGLASMNIETEEARGYLVAPPTNFVVDGLFAEWLNPQEDRDEEPVENENVDITNYDAAGKLEETHFYLRVDGEVLAGVDVPATRAIQVPSEGGDDSTGGEPGEPQAGTQEERPLPVRTGEDAVYIFLDTEAGGYDAFNIPFDADYMVEIKGQNGQILSARYMEFDGANAGDWNWQYVKDVTAAAGLKEIETSVDEMPQNVYFHVVSWNGVDEDRGDELRLPEAEPGGSRYVGQGDGGATKGYWRLNTGSGTSATDSSGQSPANDGTLTNMESGDWVSEKFGYGLNFDGTDEYVDIESDTSLDITGDITVEMWVNPTGFHSDWNYLMLYGGYKVEFGFHGTSGKPIFKARQSGGSMFGVEGNAISTGQWYHIAGVRSGAFVGIYVNGVLEESRTDFGTGNLYSGDSTKIGGIGSAGFNGKIDEVRILDYARTAFGGGVVIDEVDFDGGGSNYIKLYNNAGSTVDIRGWKFENEDGDLFTISSSTTISAGGTLTLSESSYAALSALDNADYLEAYDLDPDNDGDNDNTAVYQAMVDFTAWGASPGGGDANAVSAGLWTDDTYVSVGGSDPGVKLSTQGNNDEAVSDWEAIPEFSDSVVPVMFVAALFVIFKRRKRKANVPCER